ncbi:hypothetical protein Efla_002774 [Eimeria flavescens]
MKSGEAKRPAGLGACIPPAEEEPSSLEGQKMKSAARATAVAAAVAAVAASAEHEFPGSSQLEALNLMLPRSLSIALSGGGKGADAASSSAEKIAGLIPGEQPAAAGATDSTHVLHGYEALRAIRKRAHKFRTGYHNWRRHQARGARGDIHDVFVEGTSPSGNAVSDWMLRSCGVATETAGILMRAANTVSGSQERSAPRSAGPVPPTPSAHGEHYSTEVSHEKVERPHWLRFFFNPHTPLQSEGVWPLRRDFLSHIAARASVPQYPLNSSEIKCWIAHVGVGGFHRSHQCVFYDDLLAKTSAGLPDDLPEGVNKGPWAVCGIGILPSDKRMSAVLHEQEFLYTVLTRSQRLCEARVIGSLMDFVFAPEEPKRLRGLLVDERTKMLSLTITEKGYCMATDGNLDKTLEPVKQDLKNCTIPRTALGLIFLGLKLRRAAGVQPFTVLSCDNIPNNGKACL